MSDIDWVFIGGEEGHKLQGYVPDRSKSKSGVTIASGFDLSERTEASLRQGGVSEDLIKRLKPFLGLRGLEAEKVAKNLVVTRAEAALLNRLAKRETMEWLPKTYNSAIQPGALRWEELFMEARTTITSVAFQYGYLPKKTPKFWKYVKLQDWGQAISELRNFSDRYPSRRNREAAKLEAGWRRHKETSVTEGESAVNPVPPLHLHDQQRQDSEDPFGSHVITLP